MTSGDAGPKLRAVYIAPEFWDEIKDAVRGSESLVACHVIGYWDAKFSPGLNADERARLAGSMILKGLEVLDWKQGSLRPPTQEERSNGAPHVWVDNRFGVALLDASPAVVSELETVRTIRDTLQRNALRARYRKDTLPVPSSPLFSLDAFPRPTGASKYPPAEPLRWLLARCTALFLWDHSESGLCCHVIDNSSKVVPAFVEQCEAAGIPVVQLPDAHGFPVT